MRNRSLSMLLVILFITGCLGFSRSGAPNPVVLTENLLTFEEEITEDFLYHHLSVIAHDSLEGRATGMRGQKIAADYLADFYSELGFTPLGDDNSWFQHFNLEAEKTDSLVYYTWRVEEGDTLLVNHSVASPDQESDYLQIFGGSRPLRGEIVFAGFGVRDTVNGINHQEGADLSERWVLLFDDIPHVVDGDTLMDPQISRNQRFSEIISRNNASGILVIGEETPEQFAELRELNSRLVTKPRNMRLDYLDSMMARRGYPRGYMQINPELAVELLELENLQELRQLRQDLIANLDSFSARPLPFILDYRPYESPATVETENVLAFFEGSDPELKDEVVVLTAHYDHIGISLPDEDGDTINNGADDDGSGTVALMAIANALHQASEEGWRPRRSILFLHVSAEEVGLLGSRYYSDHPVIPIEQTVANFNADMISRSTTEREESGETDYIFIIGGDIISSRLDSLVHVANNQSVQMELDYTFNDLNDPNQFYRRSDHWNLGRLEVPFVFFFTGVHEDYHNQGDTVDKVDFPKLSRTTRLIYASTLQVANNEERPLVDNQQFIDITRSRPR